MTIRSRIESGFAAWGRWVVRHAWLTLFATLALTAVLAGHLTALRVDNSNEVFLRAGDPERARLDRFREQFGRDDRIIISVGPTHVFELDTLERLRALHRDIERSAPFVEEVSSLFNARDTRGVGDELVVDELIASWPLDPAALSTIRARALANPLFVGTLISRDERYTTLSIKPHTYSSEGASETVDAALEGFGDEEAPSGRPPEYLTEHETREVVEAIANVVAAHDSEGFPLQVMGGPVLDVALTDTLQRDVSVFLPISILVIVILLGALFRRVSGVVIPVAIVLSALASSMGLMALLDIPFSITLNILPPFVVVVGVSDSVHLLVIVYQRLAAGADRAEAISGALGHAGLAVVMTSLTTAAGLASFVAAPLAPVAQLGVIAPAGVLLAMVFSLTMLPALLALAPPRVGGRARAGVGGGAAERAMVAVGDVSTRHPWWVVGATTLLVVVGFGGISRLSFSHDGMAWFPLDHPLRKAHSLIDSSLGGAGGLEVVVYGDQENALHAPELVARLDRIAEFAQTLEVDGRPIQHTLSIVDIVKETHQALNENRAEFYALPGERKLLAQEMLLFENSGSDDFEDFTDSQLSLARISIRTPWADAMIYTELIEALNVGIREILAERSRFELTGGAVLFARVFEGLIVTMARSYAIALIVITPMLVLLVGDVRRGLAAMVPNLVPIYLVLALMGWAGIPLDASTLLIGGILLGLVVDDTIHFMHKFNRYLEETGDARAAIRETLSTTGTALLLTSMILSLGFAVFLAAELNNTFWFGLLASLAAVLAFLADVVLAPALMVLIHRGRDRSASHDPVRRALVSD